MAEDIIQAIRCFVCASATGILKRCPAPSSPHSENNNPFFLFLKKNGQIEQGLVQTNPKYRRSDIYKNVHIDKSWCVQKALMIWDMYKFIQLKTKEYRNLYAFAQN